MGCASSREKYEKADITATECKVKEEFKVLPGVKPLKSATTFEIQSHIFRIREDMDIKGSDGTVHAKLLGKLLSLRDRQTLASASGKKMLTLIRKILTFKPAFYFYTYTPNFEGQESTEKDGDEPLYKFALLQSIFLSLPPRWEYSLFTTSNDTCEKVADLSAMCTFMYAKGSMYDLTGSPLMRLTQKNLVKGSEKGAAGFYDVEVSAGMDPMQALAVAIAAPQTLEN